MLRDYTEVLGTITVPVLVANGDSEYLAFGARTGQYVANSIPKGCLVIFESSGHMPFYEEADRFNKALGDLLEC